ncbi:MAG: hypothetical protein K2K37_05440, partial [Muribaculaceae bacterium]|nr:hypothetical protein [Muribaculaceae bacterium]
IEGSILAFFYVVASSQICPQRSCDISGTKVSTFPRYIMLKIRKCATVPKRNPTASMKPWDPVVYAAVISR